VGSQDCDDPTFAIVANVVNAFGREFERDEKSGRSSVTQGPIEVGGVVDQEVFSDQHLDFIVRQPFHESAETAASRTPKIVQKY
jgi:hypothetical protein